MIKHETSQEIRYHMLWLGQELGLLKLQWSQPAPMLHRATSKFQTLSG